MHLLNTIHKSQEGGNSTALNKANYFVTVTDKKDRNKALSRRNMFLKLLCPKIYSHVTQILLSFLCHVTQHEYFRQNDNSEQTSL